MAFPKGFFWGAASASYQVEGGWNVDGKGPSVWDVFCRKEGAVWNGDTGDVACDHYHRYKEDVALMKDIGLKAYRFSLSWPRILPEGTGPINQTGLDFYSRLVDSLHEAGIEPFLTLFHWDYPTSLYNRGGWLNRDSSDWFAEYTQVVVDRLSDRVRYWMTINEPQVFIMLGHQDGRHAPGIGLSWRELTQCGHNALLAHGKSAQVIRNRSKRKPQIGWAPVGLAAIPATDQTEDVQAARDWMFSGRQKTLWTNTWWMDPVFRGTYPKDGLETFGPDGPEIRDGDMETIHQPLDFFGMNSYQGQPVAAAEDGKPKEVAFGAGRKMTLMHWNVTPDCLYWGPKLFHERYGLPIVITENGMSCIDWVALDGKVHDPQRIDYTTRHLSALKRAGEDGVPIMGYMHWTIMDNFEWAEGYKQRFGLIYVDFETQKRTMKDSAHWYRQVIAENGASI